MGVIFSKMLILIGKLLFFIHLRGCLHQAFALHAPSMYSQTSLKRTPKGQSEVSVLGWICRVIFTCVNG